LPVTLSSGQPFGAVKPAPAGTSPEKLIGSIGK
jgi:hypothetical protein